MAGRSAKSKNRGSDLFGLNVSGKNKEYHTFETSAAANFSGITATGGVISDYSSGGSIYRTHIFTSSGTFDVTATGQGYPNSIEYLVIAGGGSGGGGYYGGGGGAGGVRTNLSGHPLATGNPSFVASVASYTVTVGGGGAVTQTDPGGAGGDGSPGDNSYFGPPVPSNGITAHGGGAGRGRNSTTAAGIAGGSGGGTAYGPPGAGGFGLNPTTPAPALAPFTAYQPGTTEGNPGGDNPSSSYYGSGGGGAGGAAPPGPDAEPAPGFYGYPGGVGTQVLIAGPANAGIGSTGPSSNYGYFAGGGGGGGARTYPEMSRGGYGGGGDGAGPTIAGESGTYSTGSGGGGGTIGSNAGNGGSGIVMLRYIIGSLAASAKATGGSISYYNGKVIHTFLHSGDFNNTTGSPLSTEVVIIGGGGGGGVDTPSNYGAGGGGAGGYYTNTQVVSNGPNTIVVGSGGKGRASVMSPTSTIIGGPGDPGNFTSAFGITMGGGAGGTGGAAAPNPGGVSGGGVSYADAAPADFTGAPFPGTIQATPPAGWGHAGGDGSPSPGDCPGTGGGGAGGDGNVASSPTTNGSQGGLGMQLPSTFRNPQSDYALGGSGPTSPTWTNADTSGKYWFAGGGGGSVVPSVGVQGNRGAGGIGFPHPSPSATVIGPWAGAGDGKGRDGASPNSGDALANTGSGGGGSGYYTPAAGYRNNGGSGIVLIAYPS